MEYIVSGLSLIAWDTICKPKILGLALIKLVWKKWAHIIRGKFFKCKSFVQHHAKKLWLVYYESHYPIDLSY